MAASTGARLRALAAESVDAVVTAGRSLDTVLQQAEAKVPDDDRPMLRLLCFGSLRNHWRLRAQIRRLVNRPLKKKDSVIEALLAIGIYQLTETRVPDHAAVSMTVDAVKVLRRPKFGSLVNAVLRNFLRRNLRDRKAESDEERFNHPDWLIDAIRDDWPEQWPDVLAANNARAPMWLRVNSRRTTRDDYLASLENDTAAVLRGLDDAIRLAKPQPATALPGFADGLVSVQDGAAQIAARWLLGDLQRDGTARLLDACAAPGGKTAHLLEIMPGAQLTAIEFDTDRMQVLRSNLGRLGLDDGATLCVGDASAPAGWWDGQQFERVLLDAPCSASGVIRRHPDIKLNRRATDIDALAARQTAFLDALWPLLVPGGRLLYVTCSVLRRENEAVVSDFLARQKDANESDLLPNNNIRDLMVRMACGYQILPGREGLDGFYYACLEKDPSQAA